MEEDTKYSQKVFLKFPRQSKILKTLFIWMVWDTAVIIFCDIRCYSDHQHSRTGKASGIKAWA